MDIETETNNTLQLSASMGIVEVVKLLISQGADPNNASGAPLWTASSMRTYERCY